MLKENKGMSMIALIIIVLIIVVLAIFGVKIGSQMLSEEKLEDVKTNMLLIQGKIKTIAEKNEIKPEEELLAGIKIEKATNYEVEGYTIPEELKNKLEKEEYYIWGKKELEEKGLNTIEADNSQKFYIVDYVENEVFYSLGYEGIYDLSSLKEMEK